MATQMSYEDYNTYLKNKQSAEAQHAQTGQWNAALGQQNQAIRDKYGMGADNQNAQQFENAYAWMYNGQNQQQSTPYDTAYNNVKSQYDAAAQQAQAARQAATKQAIAGIENMRPGIQQSAEEQARQAYVNNQRNVNMLPWQMKMLGLTGGASESSMVGENARFGNLHGQIMTNRENQLRELENAKQQAQMQGDYDIASLQSDFARQYADIYAQMAGRQLDDEIDTMRWNRQAARDDYLRADDKAWETNWRNEGWDRDDKLIQQGYTREDLLRGQDQDWWYDQQDYTHNQNKDMLNYQWMNAPKTTSSGKKTTTTKKPETDLGDDETSAAQNILALGRGPLKQEELNRLIQLGEVVVMQNDDGSYSYKNRFSQSPYGASGGSSWLSN